MSEESESFCFCFTSGNLTDASGHFQRTKEKVLRISENQQTSSLFSQVGQRLPEQWYFFAWKTQQIHDYEVILKKHESRALAVFVFFWCLNLFLSKLDDGWRQFLRGTDLATNAHQAQATKVVQGPSFTQILRVVASSDSMFCFNIKPNKKRLNDHKRQNKNHT